MEYDYNVKRVSVYSGFLAVLEFSTFCTFSLFSPNSTSLLLVVHGVQYFAPLSIVSASSTCFSPTSPSFCLFIHWCTKILFLIVRRYDGTQGGQSRGQHDWVHGFPEPVKSFITFVILNQISCGKFKKNLIFFLHKTVSQFLLGLL